MPAWAKSEPDIMLSDILQDQLANSCVAGCGSKHIGIPQIGPEKHSLTKL